MEEPMPVLEPVAEPVSVVPLAYDDYRLTNPWQPVLRLVSMAVLAQGVTVVLPFPWELATSLIQQNFRATFRTETLWELLFVLVGVIRLAAGVFLVIGAQLTRTGRHAGWWCVVVGELILIVQCLTQSAMNIVRLLQMSSSSTQIVTVVVDTLLWSSSAFVMPVLVLMLFRRREVRDVFTDR